jgi:hypothetical protein
VQIFFFWSLNSFFGDFVLIEDLNFDFLLNGEIERRGIKMKKMPNIGSVP